MSYSYSSTIPVDEEYLPRRTSKRSRSGLTAITIAALTMTASLPAELSASRWTATPVSAPKQSLLKSAHNAGASMMTGGVPNISDDTIKPLSSISTLRDLSGLTADQIGRLFGVSRRSVQSWIAGASMSSANEERLSHLMRLMLTVGSTPEERKHKLLDSSGGTSIFHSLMQQLADPEVLQPNPISVRAQFGA